MDHGLLQPAATRCFVTDFLHKIEHCTDPFDARVHCEWALIAFAGRTGFDIRMEHLEPEPICNRDLSRLAGYPHAKGIRIGGIGRVWIAEKSSYADRTEDPGEPVSEFEWLLRIISKHHDAKWDGLALTDGVIYSKEQWETYVEDLRRLNEILRRYCLAASDTQAKQPSLYQLPPPWVGGPPLFGLEKWIQFNESVVRDYRSWSRRDDAPFKKGGPQQTSMLRKHLVRHLLTVCRGKNGGSDDTLRPFKRFSRLHDQYDPDEDKSVEMALEARARARNGTGVGRFLTLLDIALLLFALELAAPHPDLKMPPGEYLTNLKQAVADDWKQMKREFKRPTATQ